MKNSSVPTKKQLVKGLKSQVKKLQTELTAVKKAKVIADAVRIKVSKSQARFKRIRDPKGADSGVGEYFLLVDITAVETAVYIPLTIASGKKTTGFVYQIEGTGKGSIVTANVTSRGAGVTQITSGTILYSKIPAGKTATFRIQVEIKGGIGKSYTVVINKIHYKLDPADARYVRAPKEVSTKNLQFK